MKKHAPIRILILLNQTLKSARDEISGILRAASAYASFDIRIFDRNMPPETLRECIKDWTPDGIITDNRGAVPTILPGAIPNCVTFKFNRIRHIPVVYLDFSNPTASSVNVNDSEIGEYGATFFLKRKYTNFAFIGTDLSHTAEHSNARFQAFKKKVEESGFTCENFTINERKANVWTSELERLKEWITALPKPCAMMTHADVYAKPVYDACRLINVNIPEQIALIGVDNEIDIVDNMRPTLSSILPDFEKAGMLAIETLRTMLLAKHTPRTPLYTTYGVKALVERGSSQDTHGAKRLVDAARGIIRKRSHEGIRVSDITRELNVSARLLEKHFKTVLGHSVRDDLLNFRLEEVQKRLSEKSEPIESIALQCGWRSPIALKHLFKKRFGMSMRKFRNNCGMPLKRV